MLPVWVSLFLMPVMNNIYLPITIMHFPLPCASKNHLDACQQYYLFHCGNRRRLLEDLAVGPLVLLAINSDWLVPCPLVVDKLLVLLVLWIELGELVALKVWSDIESCSGVVSTDEESALDDAVVGLAVDRRGTKDVLAASLETGEETANQVGGHEGHGELVVVLVVELPQRVLLKVDVLPEPRKGDFTGLLVGVLALPGRSSVIWQEIRRGHDLQVVKNEGWSAKGLNWVLWLW